MTNANLKDLVKTFKLIEQVISMATLKVLSFMNRISLNGLMAVTRPLIANQIYLILVEVRIQIKGREVAT